MTDLGGPICVPEMRIEPERMHPTPVEEYSKMVTARNAQMAKDQKKMDDDTDHGRKKGVPYGDVTLDTSIE